MEQANSIYAALARCRQLCDRSFCPSLASLRSSLLFCALRWRRRPDGFRKRGENDKDSYQPCSSRRLSLRLKVCTNVHDVTPRYQADRYLSGKS